MISHKSIGGYFELETECRVNDLYHDTIMLNTGRNAFEYILIAKRIKKVYIPYFTCDVLLEPLRKLKLSFDFYKIDINLEPIFDFSVLKSGEVFLYTNYFGLKSNYIEKLSLKCGCLIIDNVQAFFAKPIKNVPTFYSARKFFGVSDGAFLYCKERLSHDFDRDVSHARMSHLLIRKDGFIEDGYKDFIFNDKSLENQPIKGMSLITKSILEGIDYKLVAKQRINNYNILEYSLKGKNMLSLNLDDGSVPMVYPYWTKKKGLREKLLGNKIYTASYWPNVKRWTEHKSIEYILTDEVIYLPIDQRYGINEMNKILDIII